MFVVRFVMRHGERLDEALLRKGQPVPKEIRVDPPLTRDGHLQAQQAFKHLAQALEEDGKPRKMAFFASPTRRTVGSSLMVSGSRRLRMRTDLFDLDFFSDDERQKCGQEYTTTTIQSQQNRPIPITVLNGLGSCAAAIHRCGGGESAARMGMLPCADLPSNDSSKQCPIAVELSDMQRICEQNNLEEEKSTVEADEVQYWKIVHGEMHPMSAPVTLQQQQPQQQYTDLPKVPTVPSYCRQRGKEHFWEALDRAVLLAASKGCDTVVVVSHREGVREMLDRWGSNGFDVPSRLNYCCIASYKVKVYKDRSCRWCFHGASDYQCFTVGNVPKSKD
mmetsp:Transcript_24431/g.57310  ORF Transcript_24431/g.57310 Transcript_24431/m.57310 type:complete len:334 (-) Transcript_24431:40-1041(-)